MLVYRLLFSMKIYNTQCSVYHQPLLLVSNSESHLTEAKVEQRHPPVGGRGGRRSRVTHHTTFVNRFFGHSDIH